MRCTKRRCSPKNATGVRYDDPVFNIVWPGAIKVISSQDQNWPSFSSGATWAGIQPMMIVDTALAKRLEAGSPLRVAMVGAGYMGRGIALQILSAMPGIRLVAISNRTLSKAEGAYRDAGVEVVRQISSVSALEQAISQGQYAVTDDPMLLCRAGQVEAIIETTGQVELGAQVALEAIRNGKHLVLMNAELDASIGPILKVYADRAGTVYTYTDGDKPGVAINLFRFAQSIGYKPVLMGQIKGFLNRYRNPETRADIAARHQQKAAMVASFADGSKLALKSAIMGNATGFVPGQRGMYGHQCTHVKELLTKFSMNDFANGGLVDFVLGAEPRTGRVRGWLQQPSGPAEVHEVFQDGRWASVHLLHALPSLPHIQLPHSVARAVLFKDATLAPPQAGPFATPSP